jgi:hypothetical protein
MSKKTALALFTLFDLMGIAILWIGYDSIKEYFYGIDHQVEIIRFSSKEGFFTVGILILVAHMLGFIEYLFPELINKNLKVANIGAIVTLIIFLASGFYISSWMKSNVENAGYVYCHNASGISSLARTLVYTKNIDICDDLVESKRKRQK